MKTSPKTFRSPDGAEWRVAVRVPGASNAMVVFEEPSGHDRYAWHYDNGPQARDVTARLDSATVLASLGDADLARLFRRSFPVNRITPAPPVSSAVTGTDN